MDNYLVSPQFFLYLQYTRKVSRKIMLFLQRNSWKHRSTKTNSRQMDKSQVKKTKINITCENGVTISCGRYWMNVGYMKKPRLCILISPLFFAAFVLENTTRRENEIGVRRERMADRIVLSLLIITIVAGVCWEQSAAWWLSQLYSLSKMTLRSRPRSRHVQLSATSLTDTLHLWVALDNAQIPDCCRCSDPVCSSKIWPIKRNEIKGASQEPCHGSQASDIMIHGWCNRQAKCVE